MDNFENFGEFMPIPNEVFAFPLQAELLYEYDLTCPVLDFIWSGIIVRVLSIKEFKFDITIAFYLPQINVETVIISCAFRFLDCIEFIGARSILHVITNINTYGKTEQFYCGNRRRLGDVTLA